MTIPWFRSIRPMNGVLLAVPMTLLGFHLVGHKVLEGIPCTLVVFIIYSATIVWNDYWDREIDVRKGRTLAHNNPKKFFAYCIAWWLATAFSICWLWFIWGAFSGFVALWLSLIGILYTPAQKNALTKNGSVAIWSSSLLLFSIARGYLSTPALWSLFAAAGLVNYGREVLKDNEDIECDGIAKGTLTKLLGEQNAILFAGCSISAGTGIAIATLGLAGFLIVPFCAGSIVLASKSKYKLSVGILKIGMILFLASLFFQQP